MQLYAKEQWDEIIKIGEKLFLDGTEDVKILNDLAVSKEENNRRYIQSLREDLLSQSRV